jgi:photosystem II stability/assembly factor-like uncharacterized protein
MRLKDRSRLVGRPTAARTLAVLACAGGLASWAPRVAAASGPWQSLGPDGGSVLGLAVDPLAPGMLYAAGGGGGLYKTLDGGQSWHHSDAALLPNSVLQVAVDPVAPSTVYAATAKGVWRSGDGGTTWRPAGGALANAYVTCIAIAPRAHQTLYAGSGNQVWKSQDGGASWVASGKGLPPQGIGSLAIDPLQPATIYAGTASGIFKSTDGGAIWLAARAGMGALDVTTVTADPKVAGTVWAGAQSPIASQAQGLFVSRDSGGRWTHLSLPVPPAGVSCLVVPPAGHPVYACAGGLWRSADSGRSWQPMDRGLPAAASFGSLALNPLAPEILYAGVGSIPNGGPAVYKSATGGSAWLPFGAGITNDTVAALAVDPLRAGTLYALISNYAGVSLGVTNALLKSVDDGDVRWAPAGTGLQGFTVTALASNPQLPATLYAETNRAFFSSPDSGAHWYRPGSRFLGIPPLVVDPQTPTTLYSAVFAGFEDLYRSGDGGVSWARLGTIEAKRYLALVVAPSAPSTLYVATDSSVSGPSADLFASHDGGATFVPLGGDFRSIDTIAVDPLDPDTLYVSGSVNASAAILGITSGVWKSADGGQTFAQLPGVAELASLLIDPADPSVVYGGAMSVQAGAGPSAIGDVLVSRDGGETWSQLAPGLPGATVSQLAFGPADALYAGTQGASLYRLALGTD